MRSSQSWEKPSLRRNTQRITLIALFGVAVFVSKTLLPSPIDKMAVVPQAMFLALGSLLSRPLGATLVSVVGSALTVLIRPSLAPFTIAFALTYGLLTDGLTLILRVRSPERDLRVYRLVAALTISTIITGLASYYTTVHALALLPRNPVLEVIILVSGVTSGLVGGVLAALIWTKGLRHMVSIDRRKNRRQTIVDQPT